MSQGFRNLAVEVTQFVTAVGLPLLDATLEVVD
jgi:hypothetical protein